MTFPRRLFKYLPSEFADIVVQSGCLLFRNFTYFRQVEDKSRGDYLEGHHRDNPNNDITITNLSTGRVTVGDFSFLNSTDSDLIYMFCLSRILDQNLYDEFNSDVCVEITNPAEFLRRTRIAVKRLMLLHPLGLLSRDIHYYNPSKPAGAKIKDPTVLPFLKDEV